MPADVDLPLEPSVDGLNSLDGLNPTKGSFDEGTFDSTETEPASKGFFLRRSTQRSPGASKLSPYPLDSKLDPKRDGESVPPSVEPEDKNKNKDKDEGKPQDRDGRQRQQQGKGAEETLETGGISSISEDASKAFHFSHKELLTLLAPLNIETWRKEASALQTILPWNGSLGNLSMILKASAPLLEFAGIETAERRYPFEDASGQTWCLVQGQFLAQELAWVELPTRFHSHHYITLERLYTRGRFSYFAIVALLTPGIESDWQVNIQFHFVPRLPKLKLIAVPVVEHYLNRLRGYLELFGEQEEDLFAKFSPIYSGGMDGTRINLALAIEWERHMAKSAERFRRQDPTAFHDFLRRPEVTPSRMAHLEQAWEERMRLARLAQLPDEGRFTEEAETSLHRAGVSSCLPKSDRKAFLKAIAELPTSLKTNLCSVSLSEILHREESALLAFFAEGVESGFFALESRGQCPRCHTLFALASSPKTKATKITKATQATKATEGTEATGMAELNCPFCFHHWPLSSKTIHFVVSLREQTLYDLPNMKTPGKTFAQTFHHTPSDLPLLESLEVFAGDGLILQEFLPNAKEWSRHLLLEPGTYELFSSGKAKGLRFRISPDPEHPQAEMSTPVPLIRTAQGELLSVTPSEASPVHDPQAQTSPPASATVDLVLRTSKICLMIENQNETFEHHAYIRLISMETPSFWGTDGFPEEHERGEEAGTTPTWQPPHTRLTLERFLPYLLRHAKQTLQNLIEEHFSFFHLRFDHRPLLLYESFPDYGSLLQSQSKLQSQPQSYRQTHNKKNASTLKTSVVAKGENTPVKSEPPTPPALIARTLLRAEDEWLHLLKETWGVTGFRGFPHQWLFLLPDNEVAIRLVLNVFVRYQQASKAVRHALPIKLALMSGPGELFEETSSPFDGLATGNDAARNDDREESKGHLSAPIQRSALKTKRLVGETVDVLNRFLNHISEPAVLMSRSFMEHLLIEKWLRDHRVYVRKVTLSSITFFMMTFAGQEDSEKD